MRMTARTAWEEMLFPEDLRVERWEKQRVACLIAKNIMENEISARQKQILVLYYKEKKTMPEIARQLGEESRRRQSFGQKRSNQNLVAQIHHAAAVRRFDIWCSQWS